MNHQFAYLTQANAAGFINAPSTVETPRITVAGVAYDGAVTNRPGARFAPQAIRQASHMLCDATHPLWGVSPQGAVCDVGDLAFPNTSIVDMRRVFEPQALSLIQQNAHMVWLGGDHSITLPLLRQYRKHYGKPLAVLHFDAHCDTWPDHFGEASGHGSWVYEAHQEGLIDITRCVQIGIRSAGELAWVNYVQDQGGAIFTARQLRGLESATQLAHVIAEIKKRMAGEGGSDEVLPYLTLDIDCLDPAFAPGTGTPEPGGLSSNQVLTILEETADIPWVGMDVCEVSPPYDHAQMAAQAAAVFAWTHVCGVLRRGRK